MMLNLTMNFDGGCYPNPGGKMTFGWHTDTEDYRRVAEGNGTIQGYDDHERTNNTAEFTALLAGLEWVAQYRLHAIDTLVIRGDSKLVVDTVKGDMKLKKPHLLPLRDACRNAINEIDAGHIELLWVPREQNTKADLLAGTAS